MNLNPGGLIGAFSFAGGAVAITMALNVETAGVAKIFVPALVVGAFAGNFVWTLLFPGADVGERRHRKKQEAQFDYDDDEEAANGGRRPPSKSRTASQKPVVPGQGMKQFGALLVFICMACLMIGGSVVAIFFPEMRGRGFIRTETLFVLVPIWTIGIVGLFLLVIGWLRVQINDPGTPYSADNEVDERRPRKRPRRDDDDR